MSAFFKTPLLTAAIAATVGLIAGPAVAQVDGLGFDMDGNLGNADGGSNSNANNSGIDWQDLIEGNISPGDEFTFATGVCQFVNGTFVRENPNVSVAWKGGTKDFNDLSDWWQKDFSASSKSDLLHMATAAWLCDHDGDEAGPEPHTDRHLIINYATDRLSVNGTTFLGVWFSQGEIKFNVVPNRVDGARTISDVLTVVDFKGSIKPGDTVNQTVGLYEWAGVGNGALKGSIDVIVAPTMGNGGCRDGASAIGFTACSIVNEVNEAAFFTNGVAWDYTSVDSGSPVRTHIPGSFVEGTVDLTAATGDPDLCVATTQFETRQSDSISSILDDLGLAAAPTCGLVIDVACDNLGPDFDTGLFTYRIDGDVFTTAGSLDNVKVTKLQPSPVEVADADVDGVTPAGAPWGPFEFSSDVNGGFSVKVKAEDTAGNFTPAESNLAACPIVDDDGSVAILKDCIACIVDLGSDLGIVIRAAGTVTNTDDTVPILSFDIVEIFADTDDFALPHVIASFPADFAGDPAAANGKLDPGESISYSFEYAPNALPSGSSISTADGAGTFEDKIDLANIVSQFGFPIADPAPAMAQCEICPPGGLPNPFGLNCDPI